MGYQIQIWKVYKIAIFSFLSFSLIFLLKGSSSDIGTTIVAKSSRLCAGMPLDQPSDSYCILLESGIINYYHDSMILFIPASLHPNMIILPGVLQTLQGKQHALVGETKIWFRKNIIASYEFAPPTINSGALELQPRRVLCHEKFIKCMEEYEHRL